MIQRELGKFYLYCDYCEKTLNFDTFQEAVDYKKENDWKSKKSDGEWVDICHECEEKV